MSQRSLASLSPAAMLIAILALVLSGAGVGYAAGKIGTADLKNNAVTSAKVKNGSLMAVDLVKEKKLSRPATFGNGGEGDCLWSDATNVLPGIAPVGWRTDRFGITHLSGIAVVQDGPGGDGACAGGTEAEAVGDYSIFVLPPAARPAAHLYLVRDEVLTFIIGAGGFNLGSTTIPAGTVLCTKTSIGGCWLEGIEFPTAAAKVMPRSSRPSSRPLTPAGRRLLGDFLQR